ncbi:MAG: helix-turn-helix transcriptional regulator [Clostridia bacterium]|nr:helix-turn-helix transcriptional regulator [Clostridia bacterium]
MKDKIYYRRLRELREDHDYTQSYVANIIGLSQRGYSHYEVGHYDLTATLLIKLSKLYNVSVDYILGIEKEDN